MPLRTREGKGEGQEVGWGQAGRQCAGTEEDGEGGGGASPFSGPFTPTHPASLAPPRNAHAHCPAPAPAPRSCQRCSGSGSPTHVARWPNIEMIQSARGAAGWLPRVLLRPEGERGGNRVSLGAYTPHLHTQAKASAEGIKRLSGWGAWWGATERGAEQFLP